MRLTNSDTSGLIELAVTAHLSSSKKSYVFKLPLTLNVILSRFNAGIEVFFLLSVVHILHSSVGDGTQEPILNVTLSWVQLDVMCDVVEIFEHVNELQCMKISDPQEVSLLYALSHVPFQLQLGLLVYM